ncbi:hypothetical protein DEO27_028745 [Mucilaginibacter rubeus]|uniref:Uncharacterized protein n=1 Tax=Mucilaginibacter rubeus TaxID=2027860 RepID=A0A5C1I8D2_9SPHI|nr:hypothetical protein DEO27_028745 [Mucilaginibacter rubeus]
MKNLIIKWYRLIVQARQPALTLQTDHDQTSQMQGPAITRLSVSSRHSNVYSSNNPKGSNS